MREKDFLPGFMCKLHPQRATFLLITGAGGGFGEACTFFAKTEVPENSRTEHLGGLRDHLQVSLTSPGTAGAFPGSNGALLTGVWQQPGHRGHSVWLKMATANDRAVLQSLFHPNAPFGGTSAEEEEEPQKVPEEEDGAFDSELLEQATDLETQGVAAAEAGDVDGALERFDRAIQLLPERASAYNNRAQALRLKGDVASALKDLDAALKLSKGAGHVACQGLVQRGLIQCLQGCKEEARRDFEQAARLGSLFARQQLVLMNPYAALCNQMLAQVMKELSGPREVPPSLGEED